VIPLRRMILHRLQIFLIDGLTFMTRTSSYFHLFALPQEGMTALSTLGDVVASLPGTPIHNPSSG
jgi:hypothetical protein